VLLRSTSKTTGKSRIVVAFPYFNRIELESTIHRRSNTKDIKTYQLEATENEIQAAELFLSEIVETPLPPPSNSQSEPAGRLTS